MLFRSGFFTLMPLLFGSYFSDAIFVDGARHGAMAELAQEIHGAVAMALHGFMTAPFWLALAGAVSAWFMYMLKPEIPARLKEMFMSMGIYQLLENKYFMDWIYENIFARGGRVIGTGLWKGGDRALIDGAIVNGSWKLVGWFSAWMRRVQTGYLYHYAMWMIAGVFVFMSVFVWLNK